MFFNGQYVWHTRANGADQFKFVSQAAVLQAFRNAPVDSGWLQPGVARCGSTVRGDFAVLFIPAQRHKLNVERGAKLQQLLIWLPSLVFFGTGPNYHVWATKTTNLQPVTALFKAPLPNVFENAGICWGQNTAPRCSVQAITEAWQLFITSPFNGHAAGGKTRSHTGDARTLLRQLARTGERFPASELIPTHVNLDTQINSMIGGREDNGYGENDF